MSWTSKPEWPPILLTAFGGALAVPLIPLFNALLRRLLVFVPTPVFGMLGVALGVVVSIVVWRVALAGFVQVTDRGIWLYRYERTVLLRWDKLDSVGEDGHGDDWNATFTMQNGTVKTHAFTRYPRADHHRLRRVITDPVLMLPPQERKATIERVLEEQARDDLTLTALRIYAVLLGLLTISLGCMV
ncbi:MAG: hypothetical protein KC912_13460 [Proteobacteria bacterium]|nr:hypothetical protein [Pseudomonadota bacterium]